MLNNVHGRALGLTLGLAVAARAAGVAPLTIDQLVEIRHPSGPLFSPDGTKVAFLWDRAGVTNLYVVGSNGAEKPRAITSLREGQPGGVFWSADSASLYYSFGGDLWQASLTPGSESRPVWRTPVDLPAWGSPRVANGRVYVGLGNGRMTEPAKPPETPRGALLCLDEVTGRELWTVPAGDAVFQQPTLDGGRVYFGSRDGFLYAADAETGTGVRRVAVGGPVIAPPAVDGGRVYVVAMNGLLTCLDAADFGVVWRFDIRDRTRAEVLAIGAPRVHDGKLYVAAELETGAGRTAILYCLQP